MKSVLKFIEDLKAEVTTHILTYKGYIQLEHKLDVSQFIRNIPIYDLIKDLMKYEMKLD